MSRLLRVILVSLLALGIAGSTAGAVRAQEALPGEEPPSAKTIALTLAPARVLADGAPHNVLYVQLRDGNRPRLAQADVAIGLTSTNPFIVQVPDAVIIPAGSSYARAAVKATDIAGDVTITAWLEGVPAARTVVTTVSPSVLSRPYYLELHPAPTTMIEGSEPAGLLSLVLVDAAGRLVPAPETIRAVLRSSEPGVVSVLEEIVIPKGKTGADTFMEPLGSGTAVLSAVAPGFSSRFVSVGVTHPALIPTQLKIQTVPPVSGLRSGPYEGVVVQALDADGMPGYFPCRDVHLVSSLPAAVDVTPLASSACGQTVQYVTATVETNERPDVATITATTTGLRPTAAEVTTQGHLPAELRISTSVLGMLAAEEVPGQVVIQVVDASGVPVASHAGIDFTIAGAAGALPTVGRILAGQSFVTLPIEGRRERKSLQVWVASPTLGAAAVDVLTETLPLELTVRYEGGHLFPDDEAEVVVTAISAGLPVAGVELDWAPANGTLVDPPRVTDANGQARATFVATQPGEGIVIVSASRAGYTSIGSQAPIPVVDPVARQGPSSATFLGIPVIILFGLALVALVAYTASVALPALRVPGAERLRAH